MHKQQHIAAFMNRVYQLNQRASAGMNLVYGRSKIESRYSVIPDFSLPENEWKYFPSNGSSASFPKLDERMNWYHQHAPLLASKAIENTINDPKTITHLITVSCTGMSAPGIDIELVKILGLAGNIQRTSVNFMGCYAALHGLKIADAICKADNAAIVMVVCVELCTIHFQNEATPDNIASSLLFADGAAAALVVSDYHPAKGYFIDSFYSEIAMEGEADMSWQLSEQGFLMRLSSYVPKLIENHIDHLLQQALKRSGKCRDKIGAYAIHPGGKKILEASAKALGINNEDLDSSYQILKQYGNMSSATILFVLKAIFEGEVCDPDKLIFAAAFGPGITIETMMIKSTEC